MNPKMIRQLNQPRIIPLLNRSLQSFFTDQTIAARAGPVGSGLSLLYLAQPAVQCLTMDAKNLGHIADFLA